VEHGIQVFRAETSIDWIQARAAKCSDVIWVRKERPTSTEILCSSHGPPINVPPAALDNIRTREAAAGCTVAADRAQCR